MTQVTISTHEYKSLVVLSARAYTLGPKENSSLTREVERTSYRVRRPRGKKEGIVVRYENDTFSTVTWL